MTDSDLSEPMVWHGYECSRCGLVTLDRHGYGKCAVFPDAPGHRDYHDLRPVLLDVRVRIGAEQVA